MVHIGEIQLVEVIDAKGASLFPVIGAMAEFKGKMTNGKLASRISLTPAKDAALLFRNPVQGVVGIGVGEDLAIGGADPRGT